MSIRGAEIPVESMAALIRAHLNTALLAVDAAAADGIVSYPVNTLDILEYATSGVRPFQRPTCIEVYVESFNVTGFYPGEISNQITCDHDLRVRVSILDRDELDAHKLRRRVDRVVGAMLQIVRQHFTLDDARIETARPSPNNSVSYRNAPGDLSCRVATMAFDVRTHEVNP